MKFVAPVVFGLLSISCGSGSSTSSASTIPQADACNQGSSAACTKLFSCTDFVLVAAQSLVGGTVGACETYIKNNNYCGTFSCTAGQSYHGDKAKQCKDQFATVSCATLAAAATSGNIATVLGAVPVCQEICTAGDAGA